MKYTIFVHKVRTNGRGNRQWIPAKYSLKDFRVIKGKDLMDRASLFHDFIEDTKAKRHYQYRRVSYSGSGPVMEVKCNYTGKVREMIYMASNDYLNLTKHPRVIEAGREAPLKIWSRCRKRSAFGRHSGYSL
jgi:glycine C-acetyltransferase